MARRNGNRQPSHVSRIDFVDIIFRALDYSSDGIAIGSADGTIYYSNKAWLDIHGWRSGTNIRGKNIKDIEREALQPVLKRVFKGLQTAGHYEEQIGLTRPDGYYHDLSLSAKLLRDFDPPIVIAILHEVTDIVRAKRDLERRNEELVVMDDISHIVIDASDRADLARRILRRLCNFCGAKAAGMYEVYRENDYVDLIDSVGIPKKVKEYVRRVPMRGGIFNRIVTSRKPVVAEEDMPKGRPRKHDIRKGMGFRRVIGFVIRTPGRRDYLVIMGFDREENISPDVRRFLDMVATRFGLALDRMTLRRELAARGKELERRAAELEMMAKLHNIMISSDDGADVLRRMFVDIRRFMGASGLAVFRISGNAEYADLVDCIGLPERLVRVFVRVSLKGTAIGEMARSDRPFVIEERMPGHYGGKIDIRKQARTKTTVGFRFRTGGKSDYLLILGFKRKTAITPDHARFFDMIGRHFAIAVERLDLIATLRERERDLEALTDRLITTAEDERSSCARMLHDELGQALTSLRLELDMCERRYHGRVGPGTTSGPFNEIRDRIRGIADTTRGIGKHMHPSTLDSLGLVETLRDYAERLTAGKVRRVEIEGIGFDEELPPRVSRALYYIAVEALTNIVKHAKASRVKIIVTRGFPDAIMRIADNGVGILAHRGKAQRYGLGLVSMRERAELLGGSFQLKSSPGKGVQIRVRIPIEAGHAG